MVKNIPYSEVAQTAAEDIEVLRKIKNSLRQDGQRTVVLHLADRDYYGDQVRTLFDEFNTESQHEDVDEKTYTTVETVEYNNGHVWHVYTTVRKQYDQDVHVDVIRGDTDALINLIERIVNEVLVPAREECLRVS